MPAFSALFMIIMLSSIGLPGLNGFVGEFTILLGAFTSPVAQRAFAVVAASGVVLAAVYMLWMYQRVIFGKVTNEENRDLKDLSLREWVVLLPIVLLCFWIGIYPSGVMSRIEPTVKALETRVLEGTVHAGRAADERRDTAIRAAVDEALARREAPR
jgi:NADH-quinone oxidoreductase subunit M